MNDMNGYNLLMDMLKNEATPEDIVNDLLSKQHEVRRGALNVVLHTCTDITAIVWVHVPLCLESICDIMTYPFGHTPSLSSKLPQRGAERLQQIELARIAAAVFSVFCSNSTTWEHLAMNYSCWLLTGEQLHVIDDVTVGYLVCSAMCNLIQSNEILSLLLSDEELLEHMSVWVSQKLLMKNGVNTSDSNVSLGTLDLNLLLTTYRKDGMPLVTASSMLLLFHITIDTGITLPVHIILSLAQAASGVDDTTYIRCLVEYGVVNILQQLNINISMLIESSVRVIAKEVLLQFMAKSPTVSEKILDGFLHLSTHMQSIPEAVPSNSKYGDGAGEETEQGDLESGQFYASLVKEYQKSMVPTPIHRDVDWRSVSTVTVGCILILCIYSLLSPNIAYMCFL